MNSNNVVIQPMKNYDDDIRRQVAIVFVDGYYKDMSFFSKEKRILEDALANSFYKEAFYLAEIDGEIAGILACANRQYRAMRINKSDIRNALGFIKGNLAYYLLKKEFNDPVPYPEDTAYIECVATKEKARGRGAATELFKYVMQELHYRHYILEVVDTNQNAYRLYKKLGFEEFKREKVSFSQMKGFKEKIYMRWDK